MSNTADILITGVGANGLTAWRRGDGGGLTGGDLEVPGAALVGLAEDASGDATRLLAAVDPLLSSGATAPRVCVWVLPAGYLLAGLDGPGGSLLLEQLHAQAGPATTVVVAEPVAALVGALGEVAPGVVLALGADVVILATDFDQVWRQVDGWGVTGLSGRGSGAWIGGEGLAAALRAADGVPGGSPALLRAATARFGPQGRWSMLLTSPDAAATLTGFAAVVGDVAADDPVAEQICRAAAEHLADSVQAARRDLPSLPVCAVGGLLFVDAVRVSLASALGKRRILLSPALGGVGEGGRILADYVAARRVLPHRPPLVWRSDRRGVL